MLTKEVVVRRTRNQQGMTLLEVVVAFGILSAVAVGLLAGINFSFQALAQARARTVAVQIGREQIEIIRNLPYDTIGTALGNPSGTLPDSQTVTRLGGNYTVTIVPRYVDDPFDGDALGTVPSKPVDTTPADYKKVDVRVCWNFLPCPKPVTMTTNIVPNGLENAPNTGSLFVEVFDASGTPVPQANVTVVNSTTVPTVNIVTTTDNEGRVALLSLPPSLDTYRVTVTKNGYSSDYTVAVSGANPNPLNRHASVYVAAVTETTFFIDHTASLAISTLDASCAPIPNINFSLKGAKLIGQSPDVFKFDQSISTGIGTWSNTAIEWDNFTLGLLDAAYDIAGTSLGLALQILPQSDQHVDITLAPHQSDTLLVRVRDSGTKLPIAQAAVHVVNSGLGYDETKTTDQGSWSQTDWAGGSGQATIGSANQYLSDDGNINTSTAGEFRLAATTGNSSLNENFNDTDFADLAATTANWDTGAQEVRLPDDVFTPGSYELSAVAQSLTINPVSGKVTNATLNVTESLNGQTITYFLSADGGTTFEAVTPGVAHAFTATGNDLRWRAVLSTGSATVTPILENVSITFTQSIYESSGELISSTFTVGAGATYKSLEWTPLSQAVQAGSTPVRFQIASNNNNTTWNYLGPDGTSTTYYDVSGSNIAAVHDGDTYIRYRVLLSTADGFYSPVISNTGIIFANSCTPPGQVFFSPLSNSTYDLTITAPGYEDYATSFGVSGNNELIVELTPS